MTHPSRPSSPVQQRERTRARGLSLVWYLIVIGFMVYGMSTGDSRWVGALFVAGALLFVLPILVALIRRSRRTRLSHYPPGSWPTDGSYLPQTSLADYTARGGGSTVSSPVRDRPNPAAYRPERSHTAVHDGVVTGLDLPVEQVMRAPDGGAVVAGVVNVGVARVGDRVRVIAAGQPDQTAQIAALAVNRAWVRSASADQAVHMVLTGVPVGAVRPGMRIVS